LEIFIGTVTFCPWALWEHRRGYTAKALSMPRGGMKAQACGGLTPYPINEVFSSAYTTLCGSHPAMVYLCSNGPIVEPVYPESEDRQFALKTRHNAHHQTSYRSRGHAERVKRKKRDTELAELEISAIFKDRAVRQDTSFVCLQRCDLGPSSVRLDAHCRPVIFDAGRGSPSDLCAGRRRSTPDTIRPSYSANAQKGTKLRLIIAVPAVHRPVPHFRSAIEAQLPALDMSIPL